ncbi:hypothetical protein FI667_g7477, partial [Globisporangium splendens]
MLLGRTHESGRRVRAFLFLGVGCVVDEVVGAPALPAFVFDDHKRLRHDVNAAVPVQRLQRRRRSGLHERALRIRGARRRRAATRKTPRAARESLSHRVLHAKRVNSKQEGERSIINHTRNPPHVQGITGAHSPNADKLNSSTHQTCARPSVQSSIYHLSSMLFDASALSDQELVVLESTLRVQLEVAKHVRVQQVTNAIGAAILTGGVSALISGPSIVCSSVLRKKCRRRLIACQVELAARDLELAPVQETKYAKRALVLSIASGLTCCFLGFGLDILIDGAVLEVISFFFSQFVEDKIALGTTAFIHTRAAELVGRDNVYVLPESALVETKSQQSPTEQKDQKGAVGTLKRSLTKNFVELPKQMWKAASWSFSTTEFQARLQDATRKYRQSRSLPNFSRAQKALMDHRQDRNRRSTSSDEEEDLCYKEWELLFSNKLALDMRRPVQYDRNGDDDGPEALFGCRLRRTGNSIATRFGAEDPAEEEQEVDLVRSDAYSLFGECYVVRVRTVAMIDDTLLAQRAEDAVSHPALSLRESLVHAHNNVEEHVVPFQDSHTRETTIVAGNNQAWAFWDGIWALDDDDNNEDDDEDVEYGVEVCHVADERDFEVGVAVHDWFDSTAEGGVIASNRARGGGDDGDAFLLFGPPNDAQRGQTFRIRGCGPMNNDDDDDMDAYKLFG